MPADQAPALERAILTFLDASSFAAIDPAARRRSSPTRSGSSSRLPEPSRTLMTQVIARDAAAVGQRMLPFVEEIGGAPGLSPARSPATSAPVFLLHGLDDNVIPSVETLFAAEYLEPGQCRRTVARTPLISHADAPTRFAETPRLIRFWKMMTDRR